MTDLRELRPYLDVLADRLIERVDDPFRAESRRRSRSRWPVAIAAAIVVGALIAAAVAIISTSSTDRSVHVPAQQPTNNVVPEGWKAVTFRSVQFAVPEEWPVYDDIRCFDENVDAVYLNVLSAVGSLGCPGGTFTAIMVQVHDYSDDDGEPVGLTPMSLHGLRALVRKPASGSGAQRMAIVVLPDEHVAIDILSFSDDDLSTVQLIVDTVSPSATSGTGSTATPSGSSTAPAPSVTTGPSNRTTDASASVAPPRTSIPVTTIPGTAGAHLSASVGTRESTGWRTNLGLLHGEVTSDLWCREVPLEGCAPCPGRIPVSFVRT